MRSLLHLGRLLKNKLQSNDYSLQFRSEQEESWRSLYFTLCTWSFTSYIFQPLHLYPCCYPCWNYLPLKTCNYWISAHMSKFNSSATFSKKPLLTTPTRRASSIFWNLKLFYMCAVSHILHNYLWTDLSLNCEPLYLTVCLLFYKIQHRFLVNIC